MKISVVFLSVLLFVSVFAQDQKQQLMKEKQQLLESVGTLASSNLYLAYLSLTLLKNDIESGNYKSNYKEIIDPIEISLNLISTQLKKMGDVSGLSKEDQEIIESISKATSMLREDTVLLTRYLDERNDDKLGKFNEHHNKTGEFLKNLFKEDEDENG